MVLRVRLWVRVDSAAMQRYTPLKNRKIFVPMLKKAPRVLDQGSVLSCLFCSLVRSAWPLQSEEPPEHRPLALWLSQGGRRRTYTCKSIFFLDSPTLPPTNVDPDEKPLFVLGVLFFLQKSNIPLDSMMNQVPEFGGSWLSRLGGEPSHPVPYPGSSKA